MRILHLLNDVNGLGNGIVNAAVDIACGQTRLGHQVAVASGGGEQELLLRQFGVRHYLLDQTHRPQVILRAAKELQAIATEFQPDIVHCHMMTGMVLAWWVRRSMPYHLVAHVQNVHQRSSVLMGLGDRVIPVSDAVAETMAQRGIPAHKMRVVRNLTLNSPRLPALSDCLPKVLQQPAIMTVAGMYKRKGISELIRAFEQVAAQFPRVHLYLVGDGPDRSSFESQAAASAVRDRIHFEGFQSNPLPYMRAAHTFVLASHRESFGIVLVEARQAGCAIVASDVDGIPEALDQGAAGILVPPGDVNALAGAIASLLADPVKHAHWQQAAQQNLEQLTVDHMVAQVEAVYQELMPTPTLATV